MTTLNSSPLNVSPRSPRSGRLTFWHAFTALYANEARQHRRLLGLAVLALVFLEIVVWCYSPPLSLVKAFWNMPGSSPRLLAQSLLLILPALILVFRGFWLIRGEYIHHTQSLLQSLPIRGLTVVLAKYVWLWTEAGVLTAVLLAASGLFAVAERIELLPLDQAGVNLDLTLFLILAPFPAITLAATALGYVYRPLSVFGTVLAFFALSFLPTVFWQALGALPVNWPRITSPVTLQAGTIAVHLDLPLSCLLLTAPLLWLAGWLFERQET